MKLSDNIVSEFNEFSNNYTRDMEKMVPYYRHLVDSITRYLPAGFRPNTILDFGCGNGNVTADLIRKFPEANYTLLDASPEMLNICKSRFPGYSINYEHNYFQDCRYPPDSTDLIVASFALHHLQTQEKREIFKKYHAWLKEGGIFASADLMIDRNNKVEHELLILEWESYAKANDTNDDDWHWIMEHYNTYDFPDSFDRQKQYLEEAGFSHIQIVWQNNHWISYQARK